MIEQVECTYCREYAYKRLRSDLLGTSGAEIPCILCSGAIHMRLNRTTAGTAAEQLYIVQTNPRMVTTETMSAFRLGGMETVYELLRSRGKIDCI